MQSMPINSSWGLGLGAGGWGWGWGLGMEAGGWAGRTLALPCWLRYPCPAHTHLAGCSTLQGHPRLPSDSAEPVGSELGGREIFGQG